MINKLKYNKNFLIFLLVTGMLIATGLLICVLYTIFHRTESDEKMKVGLIFSPSATCQLRQAIMKNVNSRENMAVLCKNTGCRVEFTYPSNYTIAILFCLIL